MGHRALAHLAPSTATLLKKPSWTAWGKPWSDIETTSKSLYLKERATDCRRNGGRRSSLCFMPCWTWFWPRLWSQWFMREYHPRRTAHRCRISSLTISTACSGRLQWLRSMEWFWCLYGPFSCSFTDTSKRHHSTLYWWHCSLSTSSVRWHLMLCWVYV